MSRTPPYPRGTPFKAPVAAPADLDGLQSEPTGQRLRPRENRATDAAQWQELRDREARLRRWGFGLACGTLGSVVLIVAVGAYLAHRALDRMDRLTQAHAHTGEASTEPARDFKSVALPSPPRIDPSPVDKLRETPPLVAPREPAPAARDRALEVVGGLTAGHLYQSYLNIGMLADAAENELYTDAEAKKLLATVAALMDTVDLQLTRLKDSLDDAEDQKRLAQVRQLTGLLRTQAKALRSYWDVPAKDAELRKQHEQKFHKAREEAWAGIKELLGIQEE